MQWPLTLIHLSWQIPCSHLNKHEKSRPLILVSLCLSTSPFLITNCLSGRKHWTFLVFVIDICSTQTSFDRECIPTLLYAFSFLRQPSSPLKWNIVSFFGDSLTFISDYLHLIIRSEPKFSFFFFMLKKVSISVSLSMNLQSDSVCFSRNSELPHYFSTSLSYSNSNFIHDFQINDSLEGKKSKWPRAWGLEDMLMQWITESTMTDVNKM